MDVVEKLAAKRRIAAILAAGFDEEGKEASLKAIGKTLSKLVTKAKRGARKVVSKGKKEIDVIKGSPQKNLKDKWMKGPFVKKRVRASRQANLAKAEKRTTKSRVRAGTAGFAGLAGLGALGLAGSGKGEKAKA
jgi:hypothetical protein